MWKGLYFRRIKMSKLKQIKIGLPLEFSGRYQLDPIYNFYRRKMKSEPFSYSDGEEVERKIFDIVSSAQDLSSTSRELAGCITDWTLKYHLSALRGNLLRPFLKNFSSKKILEIGAGCGAITRLLGESGSKVIAVEGSDTRASIAAARCRDLPNVDVIADRFHHIPISPTYDVVTLIGVLEYARKYFPSDVDDPIDAMIHKTAEFLTPEGVLVVAIENQLGLKYFAGSSEDHVGLPMFGIEDRYKPNGVVTFGRLELVDRLKNSGFTSQSWWFPFPDYKLPVVVASEKAISKNCAKKLENVLVSALKTDHQIPKSPYFMLDRAWKSICRNGLGRDLANSFLIIAGLDHISNALKGVYDAYHFAVERKTKYAKQVGFEVLEDGNINVHREQIYPHYNRCENEILKINIVEKEAYIEGEIWSDKISSILASPGWKFAELINWVRRWYLEFLKLANLEEIENKLEPSKKISGKLIDAIPRNLIIRPNGEAVFIDIEWAVDFPLELGFIVFRALYYSLREVKKIAVGSENITRINFDLFLKILNAIDLKVTESDLKRYVDLENLFQDLVSGKNSSCSNFNSLSDSYDNVIHQTNLHGNKPGNNIVFELISKAQSVEKKGFVDDAIKILLENMAHLSDSTEAQRYLGHLYETKKDFSMAIYQFEKVIAREPSDSCTQKKLGKLYLKELKDFEKSLIFFSKALQLNGKDIEAYKGIGFVCIKLGRLQDAADILKMVVARHPDDSESVKALSQLIKINK